MSEHKFKVGDKVIVNGHNAEIINVTYADNIPYRVRFDNGVMGWYNESDLEPVSDLTTDTPAEDVKPDKSDNPYDPYYWYNKGYDDGRKISEKEKQIYIHMGWAMCREKIMDVLIRGYEDDSK